ncbi:hypothetical protein KCG43_13010 [Photobacterium sp. WH24]|uniref:hypothetical protein n=1 Tax=Photobacterium sp. WH24 TaxID=2827237 RepID=UPI001C48A7B4|nr:hypothetical protein [Photobacterium sp. WH24]MBV7262916.1 hypothetical protein [Photobacterium sp. WH24]
MKWTASLFTTSLFIYTILSPSSLWAEETRYVSTIITNTDITGDGIADEVYLITEYPPNSTTYVQHLAVERGRTKTFNGLIVGGKAVRHLSFSKIRNDGILVFDTVYPKDNDSLCCPTNKGKYFVSVYEEDLFGSVTEAELRSQLWLYSIAKYKQALAELGYDLIQYFWTPR